MRQICFRRTRRAAADRPSHSPRCMQVYMQTETQTAARKQTRQHTHTHTHNGTRCTQDAPVSVAIVMKRPYHIIVAWSRNWPPPPQLILHSRAQVQQQAQTHTPSVKLTQQCLSSVCVCVCGGTLLPVQLVCDY